MNFKHTLTTKIDMQYFSIKYNLKTTMRFSASEIYDANLVEYDSHDFQDDLNSLKAKITEPLAIVLHESTSDYSEKGKLTDILDLSFPGTIPCISDKTRFLFEKLKLPFDYFKVKIKGKKRQIEAGYQLVLLSDAPIYGIDSEKSVVTYRPSGRIRVLEKLVLDESKIPAGKRVFLLEELNKYIPWVDEEVMEAIQKNNLTGFEFIEISTYQKR